MPWPEDKVEIGYREDSIVLEGFSYPNDCVIPQGTSLLSSISTLEVTSTAVWTGNGCEKRQVPGISPSKEKHLGGTSRKDKLGGRSMAGLEHQDHFKPLLKATVMGSRGSSRVPSWSAGIISEPGTRGGRAALPAWHRPLWGVQLQALFCSPGSGQV